MNTRMNKSILIATLAVAIVGGWPLGARAQASAPLDPALTIKSAPSYGAPPPGQVGGPVLSRAKPETPEERAKEAEAVKEYCRTHDCSSAVVDPRGRDYGASIEQAMRAWTLSHPGPPGDPSHTIDCEPDPKNPKAVPSCYRDSDHKLMNPDRAGKDDDP